MSRIIRVIIKNYLHQNRNREEVKNRKIMYLTDLSIVNLLSVYVWVRRILNYYPNYPTHRLYFEKLKHLIYNKKTVPINNRHMAAGRSM